VAQTTRDGMLRRSVLKRQNEQNEKLVLPIRTMANIKQYERVPATRVTMDDVE
jgi:hypothetical protein